MLMINSVSNDFTDMAVQTLNNLVNMNVILLVQST